MIQMIEQDHLIQKIETHLSIILPTYNDAESIDLLLPELYAFLMNYHGEHEIILVDDGGKDQLYAVYLKHLEGIPNGITLKLLQFSRNFGKEAALSAGLQEAVGQVVAMMDADGQHPLPILAKMLNALDHATVDMVAATQDVRAHESLLLKLYKNIFYHFIQDSQRYRLEPHAGDFRVMKRKVVDALLALPERQRFMKGLYAWVGFNTLYLPFQANERVIGKSSFNFGRLFELALVGITSFSLKPLRWITRMGFVVSLLAMLYGLFITIDTIFYGNDIKGWATLSAGLMFSVGLQLICLGVIGEYIGRIYEEVKHRPLFIVDKKWHSKETPHDN